MSNLGLDIAASGINAAQAQIDTAANNLSNATTPGYARQSVNLDPLAPSSPEGVGAGVLISSVTEQTSSLYEQANLLALGHLGAANEATTVTGAAQNAFPEPSTSGLQAQLSQLWSDVSSLSSQPSSATGAQTVVNDLDQVASTMNSTYTQLQSTSTQLQSSLDGGAAGAGGGLVGQVNTLLTQIAQLNTGIVAASGGGTNANPLIESQRAAVSSLATILGVTTSQGPNGETNVYAGGVALVQGNVAAQLNTTGAASSANLAVETTNGVIVPAGGQVGALLEGVNQTIPSFLSQLSSTADSLATTLNSLQSSGVSANGTPGATSASLAAAPGWTGGTLPSIFVNNGSTTSYTTGSASAASITINPALLANPSLLATAAGNTPAGTATIDGTNAQAMAAVGSTPGGPDDIYTNLVGAVGTAASQAITSQSNATALSSATASDLSSVEGVNTNEETVNMLAAQREYQATATVINSLNASFASLLAAV